MADVDLLVKPEHVERATTLIEGLGFVGRAAGWKERVFSPVGGKVVDVLGEHADNNIKIELHEKICEKLPWRITSISERIHPRDPNPGICSYSSNSALMLHLVLHSAGSMTSRGLRLLQLHDLAALSSRLTNRDWQEFLAGDTVPTLWWAYPPLALAARYYPKSIPQTVLDVLAGSCPRTLQRITGKHSLFDNSYCYLWVEAFPGIHWAQSPAERIEYMFNRIRPAPDQITQRQLTAATERWALQSQWTKLSQGRRILRFVMGRQVRAAAMHSVEMALARSGYAQR
jgi:hypothetical protein